MDSKSYELSNIEAQIEELKNKIELTDEDKQLFRILKRKQMLIKMREHWC